MASTIKHFQPDSTKGRPACGSRSATLESLTQDYLEVGCKACINTRVFQATVAGEQGGVEDEYEHSYEDEIDDSKLSTLATDEELAAEFNALTDEEQTLILDMEHVNAVAAAEAVEGATARYEGSYKGVSYKAIQQADGQIAIVDVVGDVMTSRQRTALVASGPYKSRGPAGYAIAAAVLDALGKPKTPRAFAELKLVSGTEQKPAPASRRKRGFFIKSPVNHVPAGSSRWFCNGCMASFVVEGDAEPESCPQGHSAATLAGKA